jgi:hypothetical protein
VAKATQNHPASPQADEAPDGAQPAEIDPVNSEVPSAGEQLSPDRPNTEGDGHIQAEDVQPANGGPANTNKDDDGGRLVPKIPDQLIVSVQTTSRPGSKDYYSDLHRIIAACGERAIANRTVADVLDIQLLVIGTLLGGPNADYRAVLKDLKDRGILLRSENKTWLARSWSTWKDLVQPKDNSTATNRGKSMEKLWQVIMLLQEDRPAPYAAHNAEDVHELMKVAEKLGGFRGLRNWKPEREGEEHSNEQDVKEIKLDSDALHDERVRIGLEVVSNEEQTIKIGNRTVRNLDPTNKAHRELLAALAVGPAGVEVFGTALRLAEQCVTLDEKDATRHLLVRRDGTLLLTVQYQDASVLVEVVPRPDVLPMLFPVALPLPFELWAESYSRKKAYNNIGLADRRPAFGLSPKVVDRGGKKTFLEWVVSTEFAEAAAYEEFTVHLRNAHAWAQLSEHQQAKDNQRDKTPIDLLPGFDPSFTSAVAPEAIADHLKAADNIARLAKKGLEDVVLRPGKDLIEVRERNFDPTLRLLPGSSGEMRSVRVHPLDWANVTQAVAELRSDASIRIEVDPVRDMMKLTAQVPVAECRFCVPLLGHKGRATTLLGKMQLTPGQ